MADILFHKRRINYKRLPQKIDVAKGIHLYDADNLYPQRFKELSYRSPIAKQAIETQADFIAGDGWENNGDIIANSDGYTFNDILNFLASDYSLFMGLGLHFNYNGLGKITEVDFIPFEYIRYSEPINEFGKHDRVKISANWEQASQKNKLDGLINEQEFVLFDPLIAQAQVLTKQTGQVLYFTTIPDQYPLSSIDAIADAVQTDATIQAYELNNTAHGFQGSTILAYPNSFDSDEEEAALRNKVGQLTGIDGPGVMVIAADEDYNLANSVTTIDGNNNDRIFENTANHVQKTITQNFSTPPPLLGIMPDSGVFSQSEIQDSFIYYNIRTKKFRNIMARIFSSFGPLWHEGPLDFGEIKEREFETPVFKQEVVSPVSEPEEETEPTEEAVLTNRLNSIYGYNRHLTGTD